MLCISSSILNYRQSEILSLLKAKIQTVTTNEATKGEANAEGNIRDDLIRPVKQRNFSRISISIDFFEEN